MDTMIDNFCEIKECVYRGEYYSVRDNGSVMRHPKDVNHPRPLDNTWTFGEKDENNGYMFIDAVSIHEIVASAFYGNHENQNMMVEHKDGDKCNNRVESLHWVTQIENLGDLFYYDPSNHDIKYSTEELGMKLLLEGRNYKYSDSDIEINNKISNNINCLDVKDSLTKNALQLNWNVPSEFPNTPENVTDIPLRDYMRNLKEGSIFCKNNLYQSVVYKYNLNKDSSALIVLTKSDGIKKYALAKITYENGKFIHGNEGSFFTEEGGLKYFTIAIGEEWDGGDVFDDFC